MGVKLTPEDGSRLEANGLAGADRLPHPCPHYSRPACTIYAIRPWRCSDYRCEVLKGFSAGTLDAGTAHALIARAKEMRARVNEVLPPEMTIVDLAREVRGQPIATRTADQLQALVRFAAYRVFVERHFLDEKSPWMRDKEE